MADGDTIELADGIFRGDGNWDLDTVQKEVTIRSKSGVREQCVIDGEGSHRGFYLHSAEDSTTVISGLTIRNGFGSRLPFAVEGGGGIAANISSPRVRGCLIENCEATYGGGIYVVDFNYFRLEDTVIRGCTGGGVVADNGLFDMVSSVVSRTSGHGIQIQNAVRLRGCTIVDNTGAGVYATGTSADIELRETIFASNGVAAVVGTFSLPIVFCTDVWGHASGDWIGALAGYGSINGNFSADPLFCDAPANDLTLESSSPCLPGQHPNGYDCDLIGALGQGCEGALANLAPAGFVCLPDSATAWADDPDSLRIGAIVINDGTLTSGTFDVRIEIEGCVGFWGDTQAIGPLSPGEVDTVFAGPFAVEPEQCSASVFVDYNDDEAESSELDNDIVDASVCTVVGVPGEGSNAPRAWTAWPNPSRGSVRFGGPSRITQVTVFDVHGRRVRGLSALDGGQVRWDREDRSRGTRGTGSLLRSYHVVRG